jgi:hypothetical protein
MNFLLTTATSLLATKQNVQHTCVAHHLVSTSFIGTFGSTPAVFILALNAAFAFGLLLKAAANFLTRAMMGLVCSDSDVMAPVRFIVCAAQGWHPIDLWVWKKDPTFCMVDSASVTKGSIWLGFSPVCCRSSTNIVA